MTLRSHKLALISLILVSFIWGSEFTLIDMAVKIIPVLTYNTVRFILAGLSLIPLYLLSKDYLKQHQLFPVLWKGVVLGMLLSVAFYTQTEGLRHTSVSNAGFITGLGAPMVPVLGFLIFRKLASRTVWMGVCLATIGLYLLTIGDKLEFNDGDTLVLICAFSFAIHILLTGRFVSDLPVIPLTIVQLLTVGVSSGILVYLSPAPAFYHANMPVLTMWQVLFNPVVLAAILIAGLLGTAYAYWMQSACQKILPDYKVALVFTLEPVFAYITAWLVLGEQLGVAGMIGAASIIFGMLIAELGDRISWKNGLRKVLQ